MVRYGPNQNYLFRTGIMFGLYVYNAVIGHGTALD
jgi:hypothetical protein